jgi:ferredoxin
VEDAVYLRVDADKCQGHARCNAVAPEVFELDEMGYTATRPGSVPAEKEDAARRGVAACPERVLALEQSPSD